MKNSIKDFIIITLGSFLTAAGLFFFLEPHSIAAGGVYGFGLVINKFLPFLPVGLLMIMMNIILFVIAFIVIGPSFGVKTIYSSFSLSGYMMLLEVVFPKFKPLTNDVLLDLIIGILIQGAGMGIIFNVNASTGGTDILAKILNKYTHIEIGKSLLIIDLVSTILAGMCFGVTKGMYALLAVIINGLLIDKLIISFNDRKEVVIISSKQDIIRDFIINELERGVTLYKAKGAYTDNKFDILDTVVSKKEFIRLKRYIKSVDCDSFVKVNNIYEVLGEGFKSINE